VFRAMPERDREPSAVAVTKAGRYISHTGGCCCSSVTCPLHDEPANTEPSESIRIRPS
jgi:hypothetical protein